MTSTPMAPEGLDGVLAALPPGVAVGRRNNARLVVAPSGAFVLVEVAAGVDLTAAAELSHTLAGRTRSALARHLSWVPFIDSAVVSRHGAHADLPAIVVAPDLVAELLVTGPPLIDDPAIAVVRHLLADGVLDGWREESAVDDVKIDLCDSTPPTPITALH